ncbi:hypothetical protein CsSME_00041527 [Camellia sinensis var. sinensis]
MLSSSGKRVDDVMVVIQGNWNSAKARIALIIFLDGGANQETI